MITPIFAGVIALAVLLEGANFLTGGEFEMAALQRLAQSETTTTIQPSIAPTTQPVTTTDTTSTAKPQQPTQPPSPMPTQGQGSKGQLFQEIPEKEDFVDPREVKQVLREMRDLKSQIKQLNRQVKKLSSAAEEIAILAKISGEIDQFQSLISSNSQNGSILRDSMQEFRDNQYWEVMNKIRAKVELPQQLKQILTSLKRVEKIVVNKSVQNIGLDIAKTQSTIAEMRQHYDTIQNLYNSGDLDEAMQEMQFFNEGGHPGEIEGTIYRIRDIKNMIKKLKDEAIRAEVDKVLQEVVDQFNAGEYRDARETMDEYADDLQRLIQYFISARGRKEYNQSDSFSRIQNLQQLIQSKLGGENNGQKKDQQFNFSPQQPSVQQVQPVQQAVPVQ